MAHNILFTHENAKKVKSGNKTMTARHWLKKPPPLGSIVTASTGRKKETRFAELRIVGMVIWDPDNLQEDYCGYTLDEIAVKEGYATWQEFFEAYSQLNLDFKNADPRRVHYFIEFEVVRILHGTIDGVSFDDIKLDLSNVFNDLTTIQNQVSAARDAGYDVDTLDKEQEETIAGLVSCLREIADKLSDKFCTY